MPTEYWRRVELWKDVEEAQWEDWRWQLKNRIAKSDDLAKLIQLTPEEEKGIKGSRGRLATAITPYFAELMSSDKTYCPIRRQAVPLEEEFYTSPNDMKDPCGEDKNTPVKGLVHRYPDRALLLITDQCAAYCRHCTRRRMVGAAEQALSEEDFKAACDYIRSNRKIRDVLISGGDPLLLPDEKIDYILGSLKQIPNVELVRIGTRVPVTLPMRITPELIEIFKKHSPVWMSIHFNHSKEITRRVRRACYMIAVAGVPMGSQTVLLKGIHDRLYIMRKLMHDLMKIRVRPYYIYQCDLARGTSHFRTPISVGISIMEKLRGYTSGYAVPTYVIDGPGGGGKIPVGPNYVVSHEKGKIVLKNYEGKEFVYNEDVLEKELAEF